MAVEGAIKVYNSSNRDALGWCSRVAEAAEIYRKNEDRIGIFLSEETLTSEGTSTAVKSLFGVYRVWSEERGERPMTQIAFHRKLTERNLDIHGTGSRAVIHGITQIPRVVHSTEIDWNTATRFARP